MRWIGISARNTQSGTWSHNDNLSVIKGSDPAWKTPVYMETGGDRSFPSQRRKGEDREWGSTWKTVLCIVLGDCLAASSVLNLEVIDNPIPKSSESIQLWKPELGSCVEFPVKVSATKVGQSKQGEEGRWGSLQPTGKHRVALHINRTDHPGEISSCSKCVLLMAAAALVCI